MVRKNDIMIFLLPALYPGFFGFLPISGKTIIQREGDVVYIAKVAHLYHYYSRLGFAIFCSLLSQQERLSPGEVRIKVEVNRFIFLQAAIFLDIRII